MRSGTSPAISVTDSVVLYFHIVLVVQMEMRIHLVVFPLSELALCLNGPGDQLYAATQACKAVTFCGRRLAVLPENLAERHDVATSDPQYR